MVIAINIKRDTKDERLDVQKVNKFLVSRYSMHALLTGKLNNSNHSTLKTSSGPSKLGTRHVRYVYDEFPFQ